MIYSRHLLLFGCLVFIPLLKTPVSMRTLGLFSLSREPELPRLPCAWNLELPQVGALRQGCPGAWWSSHSMTLTSALLFGLAWCLPVNSQPPLIPEIPLFLMLIRASVRGLSPSEGLQLAKEAYLFQSKEKFSF